MFDDEDLGQNLSKKDEFANEFRGELEDELGEALKTQLQTKLRKKTLSTKEDADEESGDDIENQEQFVASLPSYQMFGDCEFSAKIVSLFEQCKLPRFTIISGKAGIGKAFGVNVAISQIFAKRGFVCNLTEEKNQDQNPDVLYIKNVSKNKDGKDELKNLNKNSISLKDHIEGNLRSFVTKTPLMGDNKFIVLDFIDNLSKPVANALLKTLEEADGSLYVIAICHDINKLLKTIRSRGVVFFVKPPSVSDFDKILSVQNIACSDVSSLYQISAFSPFLAKILVEAKFEQILQSVNNFINNKTSIKMEQINDITTFCYICEFALKNFALQNQANTELICQIIEQINEHCGKHLTYNTTPEFAKILILTSLSLLHKN